MQATREASKKASFKPAFGLSSKGASRGLVERLLPEDNTIAPEDVALKDMTRSKYNYGDDTEEEALIMSEGSGMKDPRVARGEVNIPMTEFVRPSAPEAIPWAVLVEQQVSPSSAPSRLYPPLNDRERLITPNPILGGKTHYYVPPAVPAPDSLYDYPSAPTAPPTTYAAPVRAETVYPVHGPFLGAETVATSREKEMDHLLAKAERLAVRENSISEEILRAAERVGKIHDERGLSVDPMLHDMAPPLPKSFSPPERAGEKDKLKATEIGESGYEVQEYRSMYDGGDYKISEYKSIYD